MSNGPPGGANKEHSQVATLSVRGAANVRGQSPSGLPKLLRTGAWEARLEDNLDCLVGGGEMGEMTRRIDWSRTAVGPVSGWSQSFRTMVGMVLRNRFPLCLFWGPKLVQFYNDPFRSILGARHPAALGQSGGECWAEIWNIIGPMIEGPFAGGPATGSEALSLPMRRSDLLEERRFRVACSPVPDESAAGTGIGGVLATVSETSAQVQGEFVVRLPAPEHRSEPDPWLTANDPVSASEPPTGLRVLLVDDNVDAAMLLSELLRMKGHEVLVAHSGADALQARATFVPDVALLDIGLPVMDGYALARHLQADYPSSPLRIFAITGYGEEKDRMRSRAAGFDEHLVKPVDVEQVCNLLALNSAPRTVHLG